MVPRFILKKENAQRVRSFKIRGAYYAISQLTKEERERGVVCASAGNHAQGVAYTCNEMKIPATIFYANYNSATKNWTSSLFWWGLRDY